MVILKNASYERFLRDLGDRRIVCFGAGALLKKMNGIFAKEASVSAGINAVLDNSDALDGSVCEIAGRSIPIYSVRRYVKENRADGLVALISNTHVDEVLRQLDAIAWFDGMPCYIGGSFLYKNQPAVNPRIETLSYNHKDFVIPKVIHYCWFGDKELPPMERVCVESWKKRCPDYEIKLWNEDNYDIGKNKYMKAAYNSKKWGFVPDYARLDIIHEYGGFYLDTDVELLRGLDDFVHCKAFFSFESRDLIAPGLGFGSVPNNPIFKEMMAQYDDLAFVKPDGTLNLKSSPEYVTEFFRGKGMEIRNRPCVSDDTLFLPSDFFGPVNQSSTLYELTENTYGIHKFSCSWFDDEPLASWNVAKEKSAALNARLLRDWITEFHGQERN
jgi:hypothetical protein